MAKIPMADWEQEELMIRDYLRYKIAEINKDLRGKCHKWDNFISYNSLFRKLSEYFFESRGSSGTMQLRKVRDDINERKQQMSVYNYLDTYSLDEYLKFLENIQSRMNRYKEKNHHRECEYSDFDSALYYARKDLVREDNKIALLRDTEKFLPERTLRVTEFVKKYKFYECEKALEEWRENKNPFYPETFNFNYKGEGFLIESADRFKDINGNIIRYFDAYNHRARLMGYFDMNNNVYEGDLFDLESGELVRSAVQTGVELIRTDNPFVKDNIGGDGM